MKKNLSNLREKTQKKKGKNDRILSVRNNAAYETKELHIKYWKIMKKQNCQFGILCTGGKKNSQ